MSTTRVEIIATGSGFEHPGVRGFEAAIKKLLQEARTEVQIAVYLISPSAMDIFNILAEKAARGVRVTIIVNNLDEIDERVRKTLLKLAQDFENLFRVYSFRDHFKSNLHAKAVVVDRKIAVVGSFNLSWGGMVENHELGIMVEGSPAWQIAKLIDGLADRKEDGF